MIYELYARRASFLKGGAREPRWRSVNNAANSYTLLYKILLIWQNQICTKQKPLIAWWFSFLNTSMVVFAAVVRVVLLSCSRIEK